MYIGNNRSRDNNICKDSTGNNKSGDIIISKGV